MFRSVRFRLTVYYTAAFAVVLVVLGAAVYGLVKRDTRARNDASISQLADSFLATVNAELVDAEGPTPLKSAIDEAIVEHPARDSVFAAFDPQLKLIDSSTLTPDSRIKTTVATDTILQAADFQEFLAATSGAASRYSSIRTDSGHFRAYARRFSTSHGDGILVVLLSLEQTDEFLESIRQTMGFAIPFGILLAGLGGYFLARKTLGPVVSMGQQASKIGSSNLHERLAVANERDELGLLAQSFNGLLDRLSGSIERQRRFMADASHELRTPVAILRGEADVALSKSERSVGEYRESLEILREEARRLGQIVENLFTLARADAGNYPLTKTRFYLDELLAETVRAARTLAAAKSVQLTLRTEPGLMVEADEALIRRLIMNLLDNAIKATEAGGKVELHAMQAGTHYEISVSDTGTGIPPELQPRLFERFFRADSARTHSVNRSNGTGAGLGLAISRWIAESHDGSLALQSSSAEGSVFVASLQTPRDTEPPAETSPSR